MQLSGGHDRKAIHFGIIMAIDLRSGLQLRPFGLDLFAARAVFNVTMAMIYRGVLAFAVVNFAALLVITYAPAISMILLGPGCQRCKWGRAERPSPKGQPI
ncbi:MAG: TRAP transporter large permease subunit [Candidatus Binataceae bacterium]